MKQILTAFSLFFALGVQAQQAGYSVLNTFHIASSGGWDYIYADPGSNHLYVSHGTQVNVLDKKTGDSLGVIPNTTGVHGIAVDHKAGKGYTSNGRLNTVTVFDLKTLAVLGQISTGQNPDAIFFDDYSGKVITCNGRSQSLSVIDPVAGKVVATIPVGGKPETAVSDGKGQVYVNIEDKSEIADVDMRLDSVVKRWSIAPGESPSGLAMDRRTRRLYSGCEDQMLIVSDPDQGKVVAQVPIGQGCDGVGFDPGLKRVYSSNGGSGTLTVITEKSADVYEVLANVTTKRGARTNSVDPSSHRIYLPTAEFESTTPPGQRRPPMVPGSFQVLEVGQ